MTSRRAVAPGISLVGSLFCVAIGVACNADGSDGAGRTPPASGDGGSSSGAVNCSVFDAWGPLVRETTHPGPRPTAEGGMLIMPGMGRYLETRYQLIERHYYPESRPEGTAPGSGDADVAIRRVLAFGNRGEYQMAEGVHPDGTTRITTSAHRGGYTLRSLGNSAPPNDGPYTRMNIQLGCPPPETQQDVELTAKNGLLWLFPTSDRADVYRFIPPTESLISAGQTITARQERPGSVPYSYDFSRYFFYLPAEAFTSVSIDVEKIESFGAEDAGDAGLGGGALQWGSETTTPVCVAGSPTCCEVSGGAESCRLVIREGNDPYTPVIPGKPYFIFFTSTSYPTTISFRLIEHR